MDDKQFEERYERFEQLMDETESDHDIPNRELKGFMIMEKYSKGDNVFGGADHDVIFAMDIETLINNGITDEDIILLAKYTFHINDEYLQTYV